MGKKVNMMILILLILVSLLGGCSSSSSHPEVSDERKITVENGVIHSLSPDGKLVLSIDNEKMYFYDTESMDEVEDVSLKDIHYLDRGSIQWSPDSKFLTFTQDFLRMMVEPDIYVVDVEKGAIENITDDRVDKFSLTGNNKKVKLDVLPAWLKDSKNIMFTRIELDGDDRDTMLLQIDRNGDNEKELAEDSIGEGCTVLSLNYAASAKKTFYTVMAPKIDDRDNGIWTIENGEAEQTDFERENERLQTVLTEVTANGKYGLIFYLLRPDTDQDSVFSVVNLKDWEETPVLDVSDKNEDGLSGPYCATFSPDGKKVLYIYSDSSQKKYLVIKDVEGGDETVLWDETTEIVPKMGIFSPANLYWAKNNTILFASSPNTGYIIELD